MAPFLAPTVTPGNLTITTKKKHGTDMHILSDTAYDWNYTVIPQAGMNNRTYAYPRGRLLGGTSSASKPTLISSASALIVH